MEVPSYNVKGSVAQWHQLVCLHYLDLADGTVVSPEMISFGALKDGMIRGTKFDRAMEKELQVLLDGKTGAQIQQMCTALGATFVETNADLCAVFYFFPKYTIWLKIWFADEEFSASGKMLVSKSADHYLAMEDAVTVGDLLITELKKAK